VVYKIKFRGRTWTGFFGPEGIQSSAHHSTPPISIEPSQGFHERVAVADNSYCPEFAPDSAVTPQRQLLFIGAITPGKGFRELMAVWSVLSRRKMNVELIIAGSLSLHRAIVGSNQGIGVADAEFESNEIAPWIASLPDGYRPQFLGSLAPIQLREEILKAAAIIVNPSWSCFETFCVAAVEAQVCDGLPSPLPGAL